MNLEKLAKHTIKFAELYPLHAEWCKAYDDPTTVGCSVGSKFNKLDELPLKGDVLILAKVDRKELRDENEVIRIARREGKRMKKAASLPARIAALH